MRSNKVQIAIQEVEPPEGHDALVSRARDILCVILRRVSTEDAANATHNLASGKQEDAA